MHRTDQGPCIVLIRVHASHWPRSMHRIDQGPCIVLIRVHASYWPRSMHRIDQGPCIALIKVHASYWSGSMHIIDQGPCIVLIRVHTSYWSGSIHRIDQGPDTSVALHLDGTKSNTHWHPRRNVCCWFWTVLCGSKPLGTERITKFLNCQQVLLQPLLEYEGVWLWGGCVILWVCGL